MTNEESQSDQRTPRGGDRHGQSDSSEDPPTEITHETARTELTGSRPDIPTEVTGTDDQPASDRERAPLKHMQPGTVLKDRFRLEEKLGAGAMGAVFRAVDERRVETGHQDPYVAVKLIAGDFARDSRAFIALQRETDKSQTLAHPNIITVYDFDRDGDIFFMTMESLTGTTLDTTIAAGQASRKQALGFIDAVANAIAYAHRRNIVHSDLKPQNVFVTETDAIKVLDFGIARAFSDVEDSPTEKDPGEIAGLTPTYASCEMLAGEEPHPGDDVYALGLLAYEMLTGRHPFDRKRADQARAEGLRPARIRGLSGYQWRAIAKALAFERADRWPDADAFRRRFSGTGRRVQQLSAALVVAIAAFGGYMLFYQPESGPDVPFESLSADTRQAVNTALSEGQKAERFGDVNGALFYYNKAYELHPRNPRVMDELDGLLDKLLGDMKGQASDQQRRRYLKQIDTLRQYEALSQNDRLLSKRDALQRQLE